MLLVYFIILLVYVWGIIFEKLIYTSVYNNNKYACIIFTVFIHLEVLLNVFIFVYVILNL